MVRGAGRYNTLIGGSHLGDFTLHIAVHAAACVKVLCSPCCACSQFPGLKDHVPQSNNYVVYNDFFHVHQLAPMQRGRLPGMVRHCVNV